MSFNVAIDGPAGAGKSTVAKSVAALKNFIYVDTGAMYRAMALYFLRQGIDKTDENAINAVLDKVEDHDLRYEDGAQRGNDGCGEKCHRPDPHRGGRKHGFSHIRLQEGP
ncbi:MAG: (d)CMP kinase [Clostridiaceae bacterium]